MTQRRYPGLHLLQGDAADLSPPTGSLRIASHTEPSTDMDDTTPTKLDIDCCDAAGKTVPFADAVRAVFDGTADPDDFTTTLRPARRQPRR